MQRSVLSAGLICISAGVTFLLVGALYAEAAPRDNAVSGDNALNELMEGNARFANGKATNPRRSPADFRAVSEAQSPIAVVIACADSRVSPEIIFDAGVGELFVIRLAGNVIDGAGVAVKGSVEYAIVELHVPLVIVLGHTNCGAIKAAVKHVDKNDSLPGSVNGLVGLIKPVVRRVGVHSDDVYAKVTRANVAAGVDKLKNLQPILEPRVKAGTVKVVGGVYDLQTGTVKILQPETK